ncbi:MAG: mannose-1-phosphate guanylyltransferase [Lewinellaceae bacterium]|nr:mannose-1-phosphate guanylyltransferase [Lewinellaceae bacterium]
MNSKNTYVAIMAGGIGSRFWPASRTARPKQFLDILGVGKSLIRLTFERFLHLCPAENIFIVTNKQYAGLVREHLPELSDNQILTEPSRNNTAPCVAYTAFKLQALNPNANLVVAPSDHIILQEKNFVDTLETALEFTAGNDALVTLGIQPSRPDTGYGYIEVQGSKFDVKGSEPGENGVAVSVSPVYKVAAFREKPDQATAQQYLESGNYLWNAGIFIWRVETLLKAYQQHAQDIHRILAIGAPKYNTPEEQAFIDEAYPTTPSISVDYAIMEKADNVYTIPSDFGWSDLGTWGSLHAESDKDEAGNVLQGEVMAYGVKDSLVRLPKGKLAVLGGLEDYIVVDEGDVLLVWPKSREQEVKKITGEIEDNKYL